MQIVNSQVSDVTVIALSGSLDAASVADFDAEWKAALDAGATKLVVDLGGIEYISSAGLRGILMLSKTARAGNVQVIFSDLRSMVAEMFKLSGFTNILRTAPDTASAVEDLA